MARITMRNSQKATFAEVFEIYISAVTARGVKDKTLATYKQHFHTISKRLDVSIPINRLNSTALDNMILQMRKEGLSDSSINSYTRTLKCFLSWCNEEGYTKANLKIYKAAETVKETYTDEELLTLLANAVDVFDVPINGATFRRNTAVLQIADDVISGFGVVFIGVFQQVLQNHIGLQLLVGLLAVLGNNLSLQSFVGLSGYFLVDNFISHVRQPPI